MGKRVGLLISLILLMGFVGNVVTAQDAVGVPILQDSDPILGEFEADITTRLYAFNAAAGDVVTIIMEQETEDLDPFLILLGPSGEVLAVDDDSGEVLLSAAIIDFEIPDDGTYLVMATSFFFRDAIGDDAIIDVLPYSIGVFGNTDDAPDETTTLEIFGSEIESGQTIEAEIGLSEPVFYLTFDGSAGDLVDIQMRSDEFATIMHVFDPEGARIAITPAGINGLELETDGTYLVFATDIFFYEAVDFVTRAEENLAFTGGRFSITFNQS